MNRSSSPFRRKRPPPRTPCQQAADLARHDLLRNLVPPPRRYDREALIWPAGNRVFVVGVDGRVARVDVTVPNRRQLRITIVGAREPTFTMNARRMRTRGLEPSAHNIMIDVDVQTASEQRTADLVRAIAVGLDVVIGPGVVVRANRRGHFSITARERS